MKFATHHATYILQTRAIMDIIRVISYTFKHNIPILNLELGLFGTLKLVLALQFIVMNAYFSVAQTLTLVLHATLK